MTKKLLFASYLSVFILCFIFRDECMEGVYEGIVLSAKTVIPALFPFLVLSSVIIRLMPERFSLFAPILCGILCGFPIGAKGICDLYEKKILSEKDAEKLLFCSDNCGAPFIFGVIGPFLLKNNMIALIMFIAQAVISLVFFMAASKNIKLESPNNPDEINIGNEIIGSVRSGFEAALNISSFIIFFSFIEKVIFSMLKLKNKNIVSVISFLIEISSGVKNSAGLEYDHLIPILFWGVGFGGICVHLQSSKIIAESGLDPKKRLYGKLMLSFLMLIIGLFLTRLL